MTRKTSAELREALRQREAEIGALQQIAMAVASARDLDEILRIIVHLATQVLDCPMAAVFELDEERQSLSIRAWEGLSEAYAEASRAVDARSARAVAVLQGEPVAVSDLHAQPDLADLAPLAEQEGYQAFLDVPLRSRERTLGTLSVYYHETHEFSPAEIEMVVSFADQAAVALETAHLLRDQQRRIAELSSLEEIGRVISGTLKLDELFERIYEQISRLMDTTNLYIALYYEETEEWEMRLHLEDGQRQPLERHKLGAGLTGWIIRQREPLLLKRGATDFLRQQGIERIGRASTSWLGVPMLAADHLVGVIAVQNYEEEGVYDEGHMRILTAIARQAAVAIQNARYLGEIERRLTELATLEEVGRVISGALNLDELLERIYLQVSRLMDTTNFYIALYDPQRDEVSFPLAVEQGERQPWRPRRTGQGLTEHVLQSGRPVLIQSDLVGYLQARGIEAIGAEARSWLGVPMRIGEQVIGIIAVQSYSDETRYGEEDRDILDNIARQAAVAIQNARTVAEMRQLNEHLQRTLGTQEQLLQTIRELSTPVVPLLEGVILLPLVGHIDSNRARQILDVLLTGVQQHRSRVAIVDITGVPLVDTAVAQALLEAAHAVRLLGAEPLLVGIMPEVAQTMVGLGIDLTALATRADLQSGLEYAVERLRRIDS